MPLIHAPAPYLGLPLPAALLLAGRSQGRFRRRALTLDRSAAVCFNYPASENSIEWRPKEGASGLCRRDYEHCREYAVL
jgi:hypothetical protein